MANSLLIDNMVIVFLLKILYYRHEFV